MESKYSIDDLFNKWKGYLRTEANDIKFLHKERPEILEYLVGLFFTNKIPFEDAKYYEKDVVIALTTAEGRKNVGRYKGWKDCVKEDYLAVLSNYYVENTEVAEEEDNRLKPKERESVKAEDEHARYHLDSLAIKKWCQDKFGQSWTPKLNKEAHLVFGSMNLMFQKETYLSENIG